MTARHRCGGLRLMPSTSRMRWSLVQNRAPYRGAYVFGPDSHSAPNWPTVMNRANTMPGLHRHFSAGCQSCGMSGLSPLFYQALTSPRKSCPLSYGKKFDPHLLRLLSCQSKWDICLVVSYILCRLGCVVNFIFIYESNFRLIFPFVFFNNNLSY